MIIHKTKVIPLQSSRDLPVQSIVSFSSDHHPNVFHIVHRTDYKYDTWINSSKHLFRLQPLSDASQIVLSYECSVSVKEGDVCNFVGAFGNNALFLEIKERYRELSIVSESIVSLQDTSKRFDLLHHPRTLPMIWMPWDRIMMQAYLQPPELPESELFELAEYAMTFARKSHNDVYEMLLDMTQTIYKEYSYVQGVTSLFTTPYEVYRNRTGVCQDFANLLICLARLLDLPARYRSGYLFTNTDYENTIQGDATHAWVEVYCPYLGWLGFDPTNGCVAAKNHIRVACGRYYSDATPTSGTIFQADGIAKEELSTTVQVKLLSHSTA